MHRSLVLFLNLWFALLTAQAAVSQNYTVVDLGTLAGGSNSAAYGINQSGQVTGYSNTSSGDYVAILYSNGTMQDLNNLIPANSGWVLQSGQSINDSGQITGYGLINGAQHAFLLNPVVTYQAYVQKPINPDGSSLFNASRGVIPVKFRLSLNRTATCQLPPATISLTRTAGARLGTVDKSTYRLAPDRKANFRISGCKYIYNLAAHSLGAGAYRVDIKINSAVVGHGVFALK